MMKTNDLEQHGTEYEIRTALGQGSYHIPGNTSWLKDWIQFMQNNHPALSVCCQHPLHPIPRTMRMVGLLGSIMVGLIITNATYLYVLYAQNDEEEEDVAVFELSAGGFAVYNGTSYTYVDDENVVAEYTTFEFSSTAMVVLWTAGSILHAIFDNFIWYATSCSCCDFEPKQSQHDSPYCCCNAWFLTQRYRGYFNIIIIILVVLISAVATLAVMIRAMIEYNDNDVDVVSLSTNPTDQQHVLLEGAEPLSSKSSYGFLKAYGIELLLAWFVWYPIIETIMFSGICSLGGRIPGLGGRPAEIKAEQQRQKLEQQEKQKRRKSSNQSNKGNVSNSDKMKRKSEPTTQTKKGSKSNNAGTKEANNCNGSRTRA